MWVVFLFGADNNTTIEQLTHNLQSIDKKLYEMDFYVKYENYQKLLQLQQALELIQKEIIKLKRHRQTYKIKKQLDTLKLKQIAYKKQLEIMSGGKDNLFDALISISPLPKPFSITNPFAIFSAITYIKNIHETIKKYEEKYKELDTIIELLNQKMALYKSLHKNYADIYQTIQDFTLAKSIYYSKLMQLKTEAKLYIQTMKNEEKAQIQKLITLIITIFISVFVFTLVKMAFRKYANNLENIYLINKVINFLNFSVIVLIVAFFYIDNATYLITILGFASAGIAIAMKDWFMNIFGWFVILITGNFKVGDRIKIILQNGQVEVIGDIIDITASRIVIHEDVTLTTFIKNRRAGRIIFVPNNVIFTNPIFNYTHNGLKAVWDGIDITITFDSDYKRAEYLAREITKKYSKGYTDITRKQLNKLRNVYNIKNTQVEPRIYTFIGEYGIVISCWYLNNYATLNLRSKISAEILEAFRNEKNIKIAYNTIDIKVKDEQPSQTKTFIQP
ncbi:MAG: mechanosensitive ion channel [Epsilonproteobacteria bacterium]|nr:mechanosensitive ion channel [Campylobacterota bacterium]